MSGTKTRYKSVAHVCLGSKAALGPCRLNVRFARKRTLLGDLTITRTNRTGGAFQEDCLLSATPWATSGRKMTCSCKGM
jgi:hypothetical protein